MLVLHLPDGGSPLESLVGDILDPAAPHPNLCAKVRPTPKQVASAAMVIGWLSDDEDRLIKPAARA